MATTGEGYCDQGCATTRPPLLKGTNFSYWKILMQMFVKTEDCELWNFITKGLYVAIKTVNEKVIKKTNDQYTQEDFAKLSKNYKGISYIVV